MFLSLLYLVHIENWGLIRTFIAAGGLMALVDHIAHKSLGIRSQAIDIIHRITSTQYFDWFAKPKDHESKILHQRFLQLSNSSFVKHLLLNSPGRMNEKTQQIAEPSMGSLFSLQILAFWLSWVRKLYSENNELRLSREILGTLKRWSEIERNLVISQNEIDLAIKVYEDFNRLPPADGVEGHHVLVEGDEDDEEEDDEEEDNEEEEEEKEEKQKDILVLPFISSETFDGAKEGMVYRSGFQGNGYYQDIKKEAVEKKKSKNTTKTKKRTKKKKK